MINSSFNWDKMNNNQMDRLNRLSEKLNSVRSIFIHSSFILIRVHLNLQRILKCSY